LVRAGAKDRPAELSTTPGSLRIATFRLKIRLLSSGF
jgi:hypothetical protein